MDADFAPILHQNNAILPRADHIGMKKTPRSIADFRFHGTAPAARGKHTFGTGNSLWHQSHSWIFQLFPAHILTPINSPQAIRKPLTSISRRGSTTPNLRFLKPRITAIVHAGGIPLEP